MGRAADRYSRTLTAKEIATMELKIKGKSDHETALILGIAERSVGVRVRNVMTKLGAANRMQAAAIFARG